MTGAYLKETLEDKRRRLLELAKESVAKAYSTGEHAVMQAISTYNELEKVKNQVYERLMEWYGIYFPELRLGGPHAYAKLVSLIGVDKSKADFSKLANETGIAEDTLRSLASKSIGGSPSDAEYEALKNVAALVLKIEELQQQIDSFLEKEAKRLMPNICSIVDYRIAAELLSKAGSLQKLAQMPASTIQLLGAEKALFRHIKYGSKPPKYGVLFKLKEIASARKEDRGRIARAYATKISIAARADAISKEDISQVLKRQLEEAIKRIKESPKEAKPKQNEARQANWKRNSGKEGKGKKPKNK